MARGKNKTAAEQQALYRDDLVRALMAARRLRDREVAAKMGIKQATFSRLKLAKVKDITLSTLYRLASALEVDPRDLLRQPDFTFRRANHAGEIEQFIAEVKTNKKDAKNKEGE